MHALNLIGWDNRNVSLVTVKDEYDGGIAIKVDGKLVSSIKCSAELDGQPYMQMSGSQRRAHVDLIMSVALQDEKVVAIMNNTKNPRVVVGSGYEHNQHINIKTAKGKVAKAK
jgi:predicted aspartyl protease